MNPLLTLSAIFWCLGALLVLVDVIVIEGFLQNEAGIPKLRQVLCPTAALLIVFSFLFAIIDCFAK